MQPFYDPSNWVPAKGGRWVSAMAIGGSEYRTEGAAWFVPGLHELRLSSCFAGRGKDENAEVAATVAFDRAGAPRAIALDDPKRLLQPAEQACVRAALEALRTPCPGPGDEPVGHVRIAWQVGAKP